MRRLGHRPYAARSRVVSAQSLGSKAAHAPRSRETASLPTLTKEYR